MPREERASVAVVGLGGVGGVAAAALVDAGRHDVVAAVRRPVARLALERPEGVVEVPLRGLTDPATATPVDWVLLCTKAQDTAGAAPWLARFCGPGTRVAVLQNGIDHAARVAPFIGAATALPTVVYYNAERLAPDRVRLRHVTDADIAAPEGPDGEAFQTLFAGSSIAVRLSGDIATRMWIKLLINVVVNPVTALTRQRQGVLRRDDIQALCRTVLEEAVAVARADGAHLREGEVERLLALFRGFPEDAGSSMYFDTLAGRRLEADALTGAVVRAGARLGIPTPVNAALLALLNTISDAASA